MFQRLRQRRLLDVRSRPGAEGSAGGGDDDANQFLAVAGTQGLEQRVVLGIRRQDAGPCFGGALHEEVAGAHQALLVRERHRRAAVDGGECRFQPGCAADRGHHPVGGARGRFNDGTLAGAAFGARPGQGFLQLGKARGIGYGRKPRIEFFGQFRKRLHIAVGSQRLDPVALARAAQQVHRAVADRAGRTKHGYGAHGGCRGRIISQGDCVHLVTKP